MSCRYLLHGIVLPPPLRHVTVQPKTPLMHSSLPTRYPTGSRTTPDSTLLVPEPFFPAGKIPESTDILLDTAKNFLHRGSSHRSAHRNPNPNGKPFDVILIVWAYVSRFPPQPNGPFFPNFTAQDITVSMQLIAHHPSVQLDPKRLTPRCLLSGSATMLRNMKNNLINHQDLATIRDHGQWTSDVGSRIYAHDSPDATRLLIAPSLYDSGFMTLHYLRWFLHVSSVIPIT